MSANAVIPMPTLDHCPFEFPFIIMFLRACTYINNSSWNCFNYSSGICYNKCSGHCFSIYFNGCYGDPATSTGRKRARSNSGADPSVNSDAIAIAIASSTGDCLIVLHCTEETRETKVCWTCCLFTPSCLDAKSDVNACLNNLVTR